MKLYNLTYDCNNPVVQQINVPTNTDYKLGIKVKRNGEMQTLSPESVALGGLSADAEKTNGYVTFTLSANDNASYTQETLSVDTNADPLGTSQVAEVDNSAGSATVKLSCDIPVDESMVGWTLVPAPDYFKVMRGINLTKPVKISDLTSTLYDGWNFNQVPVQFAEEANGRKWYLINPEVSGTGKRLGYADPGDTNFTGADSMELTPGIKWHVVTNANITAGRVGALGFIVNLQKEGFTATFTLNTNVFKSQQGDICELGKRASTVNIAGTLADNTPFDFNAVIK